MKINFESHEGGLVPAVVQDANTSKVLMLGFMNRKAYKRTKKTGRVTLVSVSDNGLQVPGEEGGNYLKVKQVLNGCRGDSVLVKAYAKGKVCEMGTGTCFGEKNKPATQVQDLERMIHARKDMPRKSSNTSRLFSRGVNQIAKKFGEEAVELVIEAKDQSDDLFKGEAGDVLYYFLVLLAERDIRLDEVVELMRKKRR